MKWRLLASLGALLGGAVWLARRQQQRTVGAKRWAEVSDPVTRFGDDL